MTEVTHVSDTQSWREPSIAQVWKYYVDIKQEEMLQVETDIRFQFRTPFYPIYCWNNDKIIGGVIYIVFMH